MPITTIRTRLAQLRDDVTAGFLHGSEKAGIKYADQLFREKLTHEALVSNIKTAIKSKESLPDSKEFGKRLISESIKDS